MKNRILSPALAVAVLALFVALGGSALAVTSKAPRPLVPCANGTVKGYVTFDFDNVSGALTSDFSSDPHWFKTRYSCAGAAPQIRLTNGVLEVRFPGVHIGAASASVYSGINRGSVAVTFDGDVVRVFTIDPDGNVVARGFSLIVS